MRKWTKISYIEAFQIIYVVTPSRRWSITPHSFILYVMHITYFLKGITGKGGGRGGRKPSQ